MLYGGFGVLCEEQSQAALSQVTVERATLTAFAVSQGATLSLDRGLARDTTSSTTSGTGCGIQVSRGALVTVAHSRFSGNRVTTVIVANDGSADLSDSTITDTRSAADGNFGHGITVFGKGALLLRDVGIARNPGIGLVASDGSTRVTGGVVQKNTVALHVQDGSFVSDSDDKAPLKPGEVRVSSTTSFSGNDALLGTGIVPLPDY